MVKRICCSTPVIILTLAGILLSFILAEEFYFANIATDSGERLVLFGQISSDLCGDDSSFFSCTSVAESKYSKFLDIPVAVYGMFFYTVLFFLVFPVFFASEQLRPAAAVIFFWATAVGSFLDVVLLMISIFVIDAVCPLCLFTYILSLLLLGVAIFRLRAYKENPFRLIRVFKTIYMPTKALSLVKSIVTTISIILLSVGLSFGTNTYLKTKLENYHVLKKEKEMERMAKKIIRRFSKENEKNIKSFPLMVIGNPNAPVTIHEFSDFLCPHCSKAAVVLDELVHDNPSTVKVVFVNYPLDKSCNRFMKRAMHRGACLLAKGAICAAEQDRFEEYQKTAFSKKLKNPDREIVKNIASLSGLSVTRFEGCMDNPETGMELADEIKNAKRYGVKGTPVLFINKKRYRGKVRKYFLQKIIDMELKKSGLVSHFE